MRLNCLFGNRNAALEQYQRCQSLLGNELGVEPSPELNSIPQRRNPGPFIFT